MGNSPLFRAGKRETGGAEPGHEVWSGGLTYLTSNDWSLVSDAQRKRVARTNSLAGVEVRVLPPDHMLKGQMGVFATKHFSCFDIVGEYTGTVVPPGHKCWVHGPRYRAVLEEVVGLDVDAAKSGNELRFVNSFVGLGDTYNVAMSEGWIDGLPRVLFVCTREIAVGEELLTDYGVGYCLETAPNGKPYATAAAKAKAKAAVPLLALPTLPTLLPLPSPSPSPSPLPLPSASASASGRECVSGKSGKSGKTSASPSPSPSVRAGSART